MGQVSLGEQRQRCSAASRQWRRGADGPGGFNLGAVMFPLGARTEFLQHSLLYGPSRGGDGGRDQRVASGGREWSGCR